MPEIHLRQPVFTFTFLIILHDKAFHIVKNPKCDGYHHGLPTLVYKFFDKKSSAMRANKFTGGAIENNKPRTSMDHLEKAKKEFKNLKKQEIQGISSTTN